MGALRRKSSRKAYLTDYAVAIRLMEESRLSRQREMAISSLSSTKSYNFQRAIKHSAAPQKIKSLSHLQETQLRVGYQVSVLQLGRNAKRPLSPALNSLFDEQI